MTDRPDQPGDNPFRRRSGMDATFGNTGTVIVVLFAVLCPPVAAVLGVIGLFACQDEQARRKAWIMTLLAGPLAGAYMCFVVMRG